LGVCDSWKVGHSFHVLSEGWLRFAELSFSDHIDRLEKLIPEEVDIADLVTDQEVGVPLESSDWLHCGQACLGMLLAIRISAVAGGSDL